MAHYAELNEDNQVIYVAYMDNEIITDNNGNEVEQLGIDHLHFYHGKDRRWVRTSYRSNFRKKYACIGDTYDEEMDMFISPQPHLSWSLNKVTGDWESPIPKPNLTEEQINDMFYYKWDENLYQQDNSSGWVLSNFFR